MIYPVRHLVACAAERVNVSIGVVETLSGHLKAIVFDVSGVCASGLMKASGGHDAAVETWKDCLRVSGAGLASCRDDLVLDHGHR